MANQKAREEVEYKNFRNGEYIGSDFFVRTLYWSPRNSKKGRYTVGFGKIRTYLTSDNPPVIERHSRSVQNVDLLGDAQTAVNKTTDKTGNES